MVGKNNHQVRKQRAVKQVPRYGLRKLRGGVYSVLLGTLLVVGTPVVAHAANGGSVNADQPKTTSLAPTADSAGKSVTLPGAATPAPTSTPAPAGPTTTADKPVPVPTTADKTATPVPTTTDKGNTPTDKSAAPANPAPAAPTTPAPTFADQTPASAATTALGPATLTDMATRTSDATLTHNDHGDRSLQVTVPVVNGDQVTVTVPAIFVATETGGGKHATTTVSHAPATVDYETTKTHQTTTFTYVVKDLPGVGNVTFDYSLAPAVANWTYLKPGATYQVTVKRNDEQVGTATYTIGPRSRIIDPAFLLDHNQKGPLLVNQDYAFGVSLPTDSVADPANAVTRFAGTVTLTVPAGFAVNLTRIQGLGWPTPANGESTASVRSPSAVGDDPDVFRNQVEQIYGPVTVTQSGGAGTPVTINFRVPKQVSYLGGTYGLNYAPLIFFGSYTKPVAAGENTFSGKVSYYSINDQGERSKEAPLTTEFTRAVNQPVAAEPKQSALEVRFLGDNKQAFRDAIVGDHHKSSMGLSNYDYGDQRIVQLYNLGNDTLTNVKVHLTLAPGTVMSQLLVGNKYPYAVAVHTTAQNQPGSLMATLRDGKKVNLHPDFPITAGTNVDNWNTLITPTVKAEGVAADGSNIAALDLTYHNLAAGTVLNMLFGRNAILATPDQKEAHYELTVTSDQLPAKTQSLTVALADPVAQKTHFTGWADGFTKRADYQPASQDGGAQGQIHYLLQSWGPGLGDQNDNPSSYLITIPRGFAIDPDQLTLFRVPSTTNKMTKLEGKVTYLGPVGLNGEQVFKVDLPITASYLRPVFVYGADAKDLQLKATEPYPAHYQYNTATYAKDHVALVQAIDDGAFLPATLGGAITKATLTLRNGDTYQVIPSDYPKRSNVIDYGFAYTSTYAGFNAMKVAGEPNYVLPYQAKTPDENLVPLTFRAVGDQERTGTLRLESVLTDPGTAPYSYNLVNLPKLGENGALATLTLAGPGTLTTTGNVQDAALKYALAPVAATGALTKDEMAGFVPAAQVKDFAKVRAVLLSAGAMTTDRDAPQATTGADLPVKVTELAKDQLTARVAVATNFTGEHNGLVHYQPTFMVQVQRYLTVTANYLDQATGQPLTGVQPAVQENLLPGGEYQTAPLAENRVPANYVLMKAPKDAVGTLGNADVVVNYEYGAKTEAVPEVKEITETIHYRDAAGKRLSPDHVATLTVTRNNEKNLVTGVVTPGNWLLADQTFPAVPSPTVAGYQAEEPEVAAQKIPADLGNLEFTVIYTKEAAPEPQPQPEPQPTPEPQPNPEPTPTPQPAAPAPAPVTPNEQPSEGAQPAAPATTQKEKAVPAPAKLTPAVKAAPTRATAAASQVKTLATKAPAGKPSQKGRQLPQTGNQEAPATLLGLLGLSLTSLLVLDADRRRR